MNVNRLSSELIDRELGVWLRDESGTRAPAGLVEDVFARTSRMPQARRWWPARRPRPSGRRPPSIGAGAAARAWPRMTALAGLAAVAVLAIALGLGTRRIQPAPGSSPSRTPAPSASASPPAVSPPDVSPSAVASGLGLPSTTVPLGADAAPIDIVKAFGSIWVADIHASDVRRLDPPSGAEIARIPLRSASWFGVTDDALWVTSQNDTGITRIDPATNTAGVHLGEAPPCGAPVLLLENLWQAECDGDVVVRIDPVKGTVIRTIPAGGHVFLVAAGGRLITSGPEGLASVDPATGAIRSIGGGRAAQQLDFLASDGTTVWAKNANGVARIDPKDGTVLASFPLIDAQVITFAGDHAWITVTNQGVVQVDLATNTIRRTIPVLPSPLVAREFDGVLWVTDFDQSQVWRIDL